MRIFTGSYQNCKIGNLLSISGDKGKSIEFTGNTYTKLAPKKEFWKVWHDNIGQVSEEENNRFYMQAFYQQVLANLQPEEVMKELETFGNNVILLCYEDNTQFCHRQLVATWLERNLHMEVPEIAIDKQANITILERNQKYVIAFQKVMDEIERKENELER